MRILYKLNCPNLFQKKMTTLLHMISEQIVSPKKLPTFEASILPRFIGDVEKELDGIDDEGVNEQLTIISIALMRNLFLTADALSTKNRQKLMRCLTSYNQV